MHLRPLTSSLLFGCAVVLLAPANRAWSQTALPPAVDAFVAASDALARAADERVDLGRATERMNMIRASLTTSLLKRPSPAKITIPLALPNLLCSARAANVEVAARRSFIKSIAARIDEVGRPTKIDNLETALKSLLSSQSLDITVALPNAEALAAARTAIQQRCEQDLTNFYQAYYGNNFAAIGPAAEISPAEAVPFFSALGALIDIISKIITPIVVEGAKIVDEQRRREAILAYLGAPGNIKRIEETGVSLSREIAKFTLEKRQRLAGNVSELAAVVRNTQIDLSKDENCKQYVSNSSALEADGKTLRDDFVLCYRVAWVQLEGPVSSLLKAAEQYDLLADAGDTDNARKAFEPLAKSLAAISAPGDDGLIKFWNWAIRLVAFAGKLEAAISTENRDKIGKAIDDLVKR